MADRVATAVEVGPYWMRDTPIELEKTPSTGAPTASARKPDALLGEWFQIKPA